MPHLRRGRACAAVMIVACLFGQPASAAGIGELNLHNVNTGETLRIVYKRDGAYVPDALARLDWFFRDWRQGRSTKMDPRLYDLLSSIHAESGSIQPARVHSGYRSRNTNDLLRSRSSGVAKESQHIRGKAIDFHIPGVPVKKLREIALKHQSGGVGYYPSSRSPFIHIDVAAVRAWPRPSREYLSKLFPDGKTAYIPADGRPLPKYEAALAEAKGRKPGIIAAIAGMSPFGRRDPDKAAGAAVPKTVPLPLPRPDGAAPGLSVPSVITAFAPVGNTVFSVDDPFAFIEKRRELVRAVAPPPPDAAAPDFKSVEVGKSGRLAGPEGQEG